MERGAEQMHYASDGKPHLVTCTQHHPFSLYFQDSREKHHNYYSFILQKMNILKHILLQKIICIIYKNEYFFVLINIWI